jgi:cytoskeletal protein RodZ
MNRNQKIALGCGGAGCLGLIVVGVAGVLIYYFAYRAAPYRDFNFNTSTNRNSNTNDNSDLTTNRNTNENDNDNSSNTNSSSSSTNSMSDDDKHKLYYAATVTADAELIRRVSVKLGLMNEDYTPGDEMQRFLTSHAIWAFNNTDFIRTMDSQEKAREYVNQNFPN